MQANLTRKACRASIMTNSPKSKLLLARAGSDLTGSEFPGQVALGQMLGPYRIAEQIWSGRMGVVYRAHDERLQREVALKMLPPASLGDPVACRRFHEEALILSKLNHPNITAVHDFGSQDGIDFLVMEYVSGQTLSALLEQRLFTEEEVLQIGKQIAAALQESHEQGIIHRDLKPQNVMLTPKGQVKVADFGLAKVLLPVINTAATVNSTRQLGIVGTLAYMPPEQLRGEPADFRSDIYSAGAVLYELSTSQRPFLETRVPQVLDAILHEIPSFTRAKTQRVSQAFKNIVLKCLQKQPERRYQTAAELGVDLQHLSKSTSTVLIPIPARNQNQR